jgi:hypothetical protein
MKRAWVLLIAAAVVSLMSSNAPAQSWTTGYIAYPGGYYYATPGVYPFYTYSAGGIYSRPAVYGPVALRPAPNYSNWVNAGYPFRTYSYYARYSAAYPTYGYVYGYPYYAAGYRGFYQY